jgi:hypothetical protein
MIRGKEYGFCKKCLVRYGSKEPCPKTKDGKHLWIFPK